MVRGRFFIFAVLLFPVVLSCSDLGSGDHASNSDDTPPIIASVSYAPNPAPAGVPIQFSVEAYDTESPCSVELVPSNDARVVAEDTLFFESIGDKTVRICATSLGGETHLDYTLQVVPADTVPPGTVTSLQALPADQAIQMVWEDPHTSDLRHVILMVSPGGTSTTIPSGTQHAAITSLTNGMAYTFVLTAIDYSGNESDPVFVVETPYHPIVGDWEVYLDKGSVYLQIYHFHKDQTFSRNISNDSGGIWSASGGSVSWTFNTSDSGSAVYIGTYNADVTYMIGTVHFFPTGSGSWTAYRMK